MRNSFESTRRLVLAGGSVVLPDRVVRDACVVVADGIIEGIIEGAEPSDAGQVIRLDGATLFPGFVDVHIHGAVGVDVMEATAEDLHRMASYLASQGTTAWLPTLVPGPDDDYAHVAAAVDRLMVEQDDLAPAARALGLHYEGPFVNREKCGALRSQYFRAYSGPTDIDSLAPVKASGAAHMITLAPEVEGGIALVRELRRRGWVVSIGHTLASAELLDEALEAGAQHITHMMDAMAPLHHREPGPVAWGLVNDDVTCDVIADGVHIEPLVLRLILKCKTALRLLLISDAIAPTGMPERDYNVWGQVINVAGGRTSNAEGRIAGSVITMRDAALRLAALGACETDVARMTSLNPARLLRLEDRGSIEEGKRADLTALDAAGRVRLTLVGGRIAFGRDDER
jgi:N-acetylglucosamine-6-phosphate deacetylase